MSRAPYTVEIAQVDSGGFYVRVGCKTIVYTEVDLLLFDLKRYFEDPLEMIKVMSIRYGWNTPGVEATPDDVKGPGERLGGLRGVGGVPPTPGAYRGNTALEPRNTAWDAPF